MRYRPEVDGLRAIAVLAVIVFHVDSNLLPGGYLGVDVFFVISGYLITKIAIQDMDARSFSLLDFYERRARRIAPALFLVLGATAPMVMWVMWSGDQSKYGWSLASAATFTSNFFFLHQANYFASAAELQPLLHTWSLAVEGQFYLLYPLVIYLIYRVNRALLPIAVIATALLSLLAAHWAAQQFPALAFFSLPTRAWEFLMGGCLALWAQPSQHRLNVIGSDCLVGSGLLIIIGSMLWFDGRAHHPGVVTVVPVVGALLVIAATQPRARLTQFLSSEPLVGIGLISYSLYLWHYPILALLRYRFGIDLPAIAVVVAISLTVILSWLSWRFVEKPARSNKGFVTQRTFASTAGVTLLFLVAAGIATSTPGLLGGSEDEEERLNAVVEDYKGRVEVKNPSRLPQRCFLSPDEGVEEFDEQACLSVDASVFIWGDSHARALSRGFVDNQLSLSMASASGCPPLLNVVIAQRPKCKTTNDHMLTRIGENPPKVLILHANWALYQADEWETFTKQAQFLEALDQSLTLLRQAAPETYLLVIGLVPQWHPSLPAKMEATEIKLDQRAYAYSDEIPELRMLNARMRAFLSQAYPSVGWYDPIESFCSASNCLATVETRPGEFEPFAWDYSHLTDGGASVVVSQLLPRLTP
jgi:peptidoglycan/LPS O-acetylase OafA/YrhL